MLGLMGMCGGVGAGVSGGVCVCRDGDSGAKGVGVSGAGICLCASASGALESLDGVLRRSSMLQSDSFGGEDIWAGSLSEGGWMDMQGGLIFFFRWLHPRRSDCTLTGKAAFSERLLSSVKWGASPVMTACGRQTSMEWRRWSSA